MKTPPPYPGKRKKPRGRPMQVIEATLNRWADACLIEQEELKRKLAKASIPWTAGDLVPAEKIIEAITFQNEKDQAMARKANADAESREMENAERRGELFELPAIEKKLWAEFLQPLRQEIEQMPAGCSNLCNPQEPETAKKVLEQWVEKTKTKLRPQ